MAYSTNILPKSAAYYSLSNATITNGELILSSGGFAEIQVSSQMLPKLTTKMLVVVHPSVFSSSYTNDAIQVTLSIVTSSGNRIEYLIPVSYSKTGVFNTEIELPEETFAVFTYRISSKVPVSVYNWELCAEEAVDVTTVIDGVEQSLPKLLYDYNTYSYAVAQRELTVGLISCYLQSTTDLQGHFTLSFFATERCNVHIRIKDNGVTELYSPIVYTVERGYASVSVPHAYLKKLATDHAFSVTIQCTNGQLSIPVRGMLYTIDGGYLATRLLDAGVDIEDISIKQLPTDSNPSEVWAIGFEGNRLLLKKRVYSQALRENWEAIKDFGEGNRAALEFNGSWTYRAGAEKFTIETEATPHVFIVGTNGTLKDYYGSSFDTVVDLDTSVTSVSACRGFNSMVDDVQDQGLVLAYVKDGNVYYRQWLLDTTETYYTWTGAYILYDGGDASFVSVHRLPDYRIGLCVQHSAGTKWYITDRTYISQGIKPEVIRVSSDNFMVASVYDTDKAPDPIAWNAVQNGFEEANAYNGFIMTFDGPLTFLKETTLDDLVDNLTVSINGAVQEDSVESVTIDGKVLTVVLKEAVSAGKKVTINYNCPFLVMVAYNGCYAIINQSYTWDLATPTVYLTLATEQIEADVTGTLNVNVRPLVTTQLKEPSEKIQFSAAAELDLTMNEIITSTLKNNEDIEFSLTSASLTALVSQVGTTPV